MSAPIFKSDTLFFQRLMSSAGLYKGALDGDWGRQTDAASVAFDKFYTETAAQLGSYDPRSEAIIATLLPKAQVAARKFMAVATSAPITRAGMVVKLLSGTRTYAQQNALFGQRPKVTNARGGQSNHNFGIAWDAGIFVGGRYYEGRNAHEDKAYADLAALVKAHVPGVEWGGDWRGFKDAPHYQLATGKKVGQCRVLLEQGKPYV